MFIGFINSKAKAFVIFLFGIIALALMTLSSIIITAAYRFDFSCVFVGVILMVLAIPFHILGKKMPLSYILSLVINSIGTGFSISGYYINADIDLHIVDVLPAIIPAVCILLLVYMLLQMFSKTKTVTVTVSVVISVLSAIAAVVFWITDGGVIFSFGFFSLVLLSFYLCVFGISVNHDERSVLRDLSFGSFGTFIIVTVVVVFILSEGEILDGLDFGGGDGSKKKRR